MKRSCNRGSYMVCIVAVFALSTTLYAAQPETAQAEKWLKDGRDAQQLFSLSFYFEQAGRPFTALEAIKKAIEVNGEIPGFHARHGQLLARRRRLKEAAAAYCVAADMDPGTKSFRAAQARSLTDCSMRKEAVLAWQKLFAKAKGSKEVLSSAHNIAKLQYEMTRPAEAEATWKQALGKLEGWNDRLAAADGVSQAMLAQGFHDRAVAFWRGLFKAEASWDNLATLADRLSSVSFSAPSDVRQNLVKMSVDCWKTLLGNSKATPAQKQRAAKALAAAYLQKSSLQEAIQVLAPVLYTGDWEGNFQVARVLSSAYLAQDNQVAREKLWRDFMKRSDGRIKLEAGKRYSLRLEYFESAGGSIIKLLWSADKFSKQVVPRVVLRSSSEEKAGYGLKGEYFRGTNFQVAGISRIDNQVDFNWGNGSPDAKIKADNFSVRWTGEIQPRTSGVYTFHTLSDDGVRLWVDGKQILQNWSIHGPTEDSSASFDKRYRVARQLVDVFETHAERISLWQEMVAFAPDRIEARRELGDALARDKRFGEAIDAYERLLLTARKQANYQKHHEYGYWDRLIQLCAQAEQPDRAVILLKEHGQAIDSTWRVRNWLNTIRSHCGGFAARAAAEEVAKLRRKFLLGAAQYLNQYSNSRQAARTLFDQAANDGGLSRSERYSALQSLLNMARTNEERIKLAERCVALGGNHWERSRTYQTLAEWLTRDGQIGAALEIAVKASQIRNRNWTAGPDVIKGIARNVFQGNRVGKGLRTPQGQEKAEAALTSFYRRFAADSKYQSRLGELCSQLAELHARRGDYEGAVDLLHALSRVHDLPAIRLSAAGLLDRKGNSEASFKEYNAYVAIIAKRHAESLRKRTHRHSHYLPGVDNRFIQYLQKSEKAKAFTDICMKQLESLDALDRESLAQVALQTYRQLNRPEDMVPLLSKLQTWGHTNRLYSHEKQWADAAIRMKNSSSQADTRMRDQLLRQAEQWKKILRENPEDYQAALNAYKIYRMLGRKKDADKYLKTADSIAPEDPLVLERLGREAMLNKDYSGAAEGYARAAEVTGRFDDYEAAVISAFELSGKAEQALKLAVESLALGRHRGKGARTMEQILDMAERSDNLKLLHKQVSERVTAARTAGQSVREQLAHLALRLAWDHSDDTLAGAAIDELTRMARNPATRMQETWRLSNLASRAEQRRRLHDAARIRQVLLDSQLARGGMPSVSQFRQLAMLLVQGGKAADAAELMFQGMSFAAQSRGSAGRTPLPPVLMNRKGIRDTASVSLFGRAGKPWVYAILEMVALEHASGGKAFRAACGKRLDVLVAQELEELRKDLQGYSGVLIRENVENAFSLPAEITKIYQDAAARLGTRAKPEDTASMQAASVASLALAKRLVTVALRESRALRKATVTFADIQKSCEQATQQASQKQKRKILKTCVELYQQLLAVSKEKRLDGVTPSLVLETYDQALSADKNARFTADLLRPAAGFASSHRLVDRALGYAQKLHTLFPASQDTRQQLAKALLAAKKTGEAIKLISGSVGKYAGYADYRDAGDLCMTSLPAEETPSPEAEKPQIEKELAAPPLRVSPVAAAAAVNFYKQAISSYVEEAGLQVDADGRPLPDSTLGMLQAAQARAAADAGRVQDAMSQLLASAFNSGGKDMDQSTLQRVTDAFVRAGRIKNFAALLAAKVKAEPKNRALRMAQATALERAKDYTGASLALAAAKALDPQLATVKRLIIALQKAGDYQAALEECAAWSSSFPRDAEVYRMMADIHKEKGDEQGEIRALTMLVQVSPRDAANCRQVAVLFAGRKDLRRAKALLERAIELRTEEPYRHIDLAEVCLMAKEYDQAESICRDALTRDWEKGLSPELLRRMPSWRGTFETRAHSILADVYDAQKKTEAASRERMNVPTGYKRPPLEKAIPVAGRRPWPGPIPGPMPRPLLRRRIEG